MQSHPPCPCLVLLPGACPCQGPAYWDALWPRRRAYLRTRIAGRCGLHPVFHDAIDATGAASALFDHCESLKLSIGIHANPSVAAWRPQEMCRWDEPGRVHAIGFWHRVHGD